ncbi:restriction endonuclease subunit S [Bacillus cereus]|nr:restriction endonuclease subunit S [Bacillus cereus]
MSYKDWKEVTLEDVCDFGSDRIEITKITEQNYMSTENMLPNKGGITVASSLPSAKTVSKYEISDVLISNIRPYFKKIWLATNSGGSSNDVLILKNKDNSKLSNKYLYYYLSKDDFFNYVTASAKGTKMPRGDKGAIMKYKIKLPPLVEQKAIANILSSLDDKIETNNQINKELEEMAQVIFKRWFVDFEFPNEEGKPYKSGGGKVVESELGMIPVGSEIKKIEDLPITVSDYVANGSFKSLKENVSIYEEENYALFVRNTDLKCNFQSHTRYVDKNSYEFLNKTKLYGGEVIISNVGDVGSVYLCPYFKIPMSLGNNVIMINSNNSSYNIFIYRLFKSHYGQGLIEGITGGSAQPKFNKTDFRNLKIVMPSNQLLNDYNAIASDLETKILENNSQNKTLAYIRDTLLPKLMSGEIHVSVE